MFVRDSLTQDHTNETQKRSAALHGSRVAFPRVRSRVTEFPRRERAPFHESPAHRRNSQPLSSPCSFAEPCDLSLRVIARIALRVEHCVARSAAADELQRLLVSMRFEWLHSGAKPSEYRFHFFHQSVFEHPRAARVQTRIERVAIGQQPQLECSRLKHRALLEEFADRPPRRRQTSDARVTLGMSFA